MRVTSNGRFVELLDEKDVCISRHENRVRLPPFARWGAALARYAVKLDDIRLLSWAWHNGCKLGDAAAVAVKLAQDRPCVPSRTLEWVVDHRDPADTSALLQAVSRRGEAPNTMMR